MGDGGVVWRAIGWWYGGGVVWYGWCTAWLEQAEVIEVRCLSIQWQLREANLLANWKVMDSFKLLCYEIVV